MNRIRVLIVEDEGIVATDIQERLSAMGYRSAGWAENAARAMELTETQRPDIVLMDIRLPGPTDGILAAKEINKQFQIPVVFLTAYSEESTLERAKLAQPFGYILKPFNDRELKSTIEIALYRHKTERTIRRLNRLLDVLGQVNQAIMRLPSREELLPAICSLVVERGAVDVAWISWLDQKTSEITIAAHLANQSAHLDLSNICPDGRSNYTNISVDAIREDKPVICNASRGSANGQDSVGAKEKQCRHSCASFPFKFQGQVRGALGLCVAEPDFFQKRETSLLKEMAIDISYALDRIDADMVRDQFTEQLEYQSIFLRTLIDAIPLPVYYKDAQYRYLGCNKALELFLGIRPDDFIGKTVDEVWPLDLVGKYEETDRELLENPDLCPQVTSGVMETLKGQRCDVLFHKAAFRNPDGSIGGIISVVEDLTERKWAEQERTRIDAQLRQSQKMEALGNLAGGIAHDFNNILSIIIGNTEIALWKTEKGSAEAHSMNLVLHAARRAADLVQQILTFSHRHKPEKKPVKVTHVLQEVLKMIRASLPSTIEIKQDIASKAVVLADGSQLHQVILNLCSNAAQAMQNKGGILNVRLVDVVLNGQAIPNNADPSCGTYVQLTIEDMGGGIDPQIINRIFDPFFTTKKQGAGTGLGLAVAHGIVKSHGGMIDVENRVGEGATFRVLLPAIDSYSQLDAEIQALLPRGRERILIVDDESEVAIVIEKMLEFLGYETCSQTSSIEALNTFKLRLLEKPFDLVLTDLTMPRLTGLDLSRNLLMLQPDLPIILCTGFKEKVKEEEVKHLGIQQLLSKPFAIQTLAMTIRQVLDKNTQQETMNVHKADHDSGRL
ncbi:MAG: response regulator [Desulforhopalus sp.]